MMAICTYDISLCRKRGGNYHFWNSISLTSVDPGTVNIGCKLREITVTNSVVSHKEVNKLVRFRASKYIGSVIICVILYKIICFEIFVLHL